jgi:type I restriction enzyme M protein
MGAADRSQHPSGSLEAAIADAITITERIMARIGGMITDAEAKALILRKHHDLVAGQLQRYLSAKRRSLSLLFEHLWDKCSRSEKNLRAEWKRSDLRLASFLEERQHIEK